MAQIIIKNLRKDFGDFTAVKSSSFTIENGEFFMLLGPSGCGKTTTLRMIAGLELPTSGEIYIDGEDVSQKRASNRDIAFVFQMFALYPHMNVRQNISYPLKCQGMPKAQIKSKVAEVAKLLGIEDILGKAVGGLSGGDRQRIALGRAIVREPKAFMMDEPLGALDAEFRERMAEELRALHDRMGATTVYVTHDQLEAMQMGDKIVVMNHGSVEQFGVPQDIYDWPATMFVAKFIGSPPMNFLHLQGQTNAGDSTISLAGQQFDIPTMLQGCEGDISFGVRPEHIFFDQNSQYRGDVIATEYLGTTQIVTLQTQNGILKSRISSSELVSEGDNVGLTFNPKMITLFDEKTGAALLSDGNKGVLCDG
jgi:multiple sugar transport system ATP-binding protein